jgi:formylglycine-generating enzyme required for sulfatase activity
MVVLIGKDWANLKDERGNRRLDNPNDFVRVEIAQALQRHLPIVPASIDGAPMPTAAQLPESLMPLSLYQAMPLRTESFTPDALAIAKQLRAVLAQRRSGVPAWSACLGVAVALAAGVAAGPMVLNALGLPWPGPRLPTEEQLRAALAAAGKERDEARKDADAARSALATANTDMTAAKQRAADAERAAQAAREEQQALSKQVAATERERNEARTEVTNANAKIAELEKRVKEQTTLASAVVLPSRPAPLRTFRDCSDCPEMVELPAGKFMMGSADYSSENPIHEVRIPRPLAVGKYEVTFAEWDACVAGGGCTKSPDDRGWGRRRHPVINVSWNDAKEYVTWLSSKTKKAYRLLTEAEWEYAARAGTTTKYAFGDTITHEQAQFDQESQGKTVEVGRFPANAWGLHDMHGNVWEWCEDNWHGDYSGNPPADGSVWGGGDVSLRVLRGGSWISIPQLLRSADRDADPPDSPGDGVGFRVARTL